MIERRQTLVNLPPEVIFRSYTGLGGDRGWLYLNWTWVIRGWFDKLVGGVGLRRGRRHPDEIWVGEVAGFLARRGRRTRLGCSACGQR